MRVVIAPGTRKVTENGESDMMRAPRRARERGNAWSWAFGAFFSKSARQLPFFLLRPHNLFRLFPFSQNSTTKTASSSAASSFSAHAFSLPHPRTGKDVQFLLHRSRKEGDEIISLLEASRFAPSHGSWFYGAAGDGDGDGTGGESSAAGVCSDPGVLLLTEVDPLFVALPALDSARALKSEQRRKNDEEGEGSAAKNNDGGGRFVDAEAAVCGGERGEDCGKRAAAALALLVALAGGGRGNAEEEEEERRDAEMAPAPPPPSSSPAPLDCSPPLSPPSPRSRARSDLLRAAGRALSSVCKVKSVGGDSYFRLCERRTKAWLRLKAGAAAAALKRTGGPAFAGLEGETLEAAGGALVAEWLPREWSERMGWPSPGSSHSSSSRPASASTKQAPAAAPSWAPATTTASGPFTRDPNLPSETETFAQREERYQQAGDFAKKVKMDAAAAAREKARAARQDAKALAAKKEASTMKSLAGFFVVKKK